MPDIRQSVFQRSRISRSNKSDCVPTTLISSPVFNNHRFAGIATGKCLLTQEPERLLQTSHTASWNVLHYLLPLQLYVAHPFVLQAE